ncbi:thioredoxin-disulfide reductase [Methanolobus halotolerans]|uniref:Thioredoxin-disulfide reductase n=1 Tax=Methanolobus halotolerans TaxID=2052935 RepID=A0A4E0PYU1_9EURY|nr:thioredoxin-disulfide reductase [Methanolobus halotolerans]TGC11468.1 thioredoxin-disulfide reductase [Methanolobus halotolerans]
MYDLIIVGGGPAGLSAGIYAVRYGMDVLVLEKSIVQGQISLTSVIENYPGFASISGGELMQQFKAHATAAGVKTKAAEVKKVEDGGDRKIISTFDEEIEARAVIIATGAEPRRLGVPGESKFLARGVSYCATCDGPFFAGQEVIVVGGGDSAITEALILSGIVSKVYIVHRREELRSCNLLKERAAEKENIEFIWDTTVEEILGEELVEKVRLKNVKTKETTEMSIDGVFIYVGITPRTGIVDVDKDKVGFIKTSDLMETSARGIYAAGDCRETVLWQVVTAVSDGAVATVSAYKYIMGLE